MPNRPGPGTRWRRRTERGCKRGRSPSLRLAVWLYPCRRGFRKILGGVRSKISKQVGSHRVGWELPPRCFLAYPRCNTRARSCTCAGKQLRSQVSLGAFGGRPRLSGWLCDSTPVKKGIMEGAKRLRSWDLEIGRIELGWLEPPRRHRYLPATYCKGHARSRLQRKKARFREGSAGGGSSLLAGVGRGPHVGGGGILSRRDLDKISDGGCSGLDEPPRNRDE